MYSISEENVYISEGFNLWVGVFVQVHITNIKCSLYKKLFQGTTECPVNSRRTKNATSIQNMKN